MKSYLKSESLKMKRTFFWRYAAFVPLAVLLVSVALLCAGMKMGGFASLLVCNYSMPFASLAAALLCHSITAAEKRHQYRTIYSLPVDLKKTFLAKALLVSAGLLAVTLVLALVSLAAETIQSLGALKMAGIYFLGFGLLWISLLWQIPFNLFLEQKIGFAGVLLFQLSASVLGGALFSMTPLFWIFPHSWTARFMTWIFGVLPNGMTVGMGEGFPAVQLLMLTVLSLLLAALLTACFARWQERQVRGK